MKIREKLKIQITYYLYFQFFLELTIIVPTIPC